MPTRDSLYDQARCRAVQTVASLLIDQARVLTLPGAPRTFSFDGQKNLELAITDFRVKPYCKKAQ